MTDQDAEYEKLMKEYQMMFNLAVAHRKKCPDFAKEVLDVEEFKD